MKDQYTQTELDQMIDEVLPRSGWDFAKMSILQEPAPWEYSAVVREYLRPNSTVLDIGTGGGERLLGLAPHFKWALGIDVDPEMVTVAGQNGSDVSNVTFRLASDQLDLVEESFDIVLDRQAPFDLDAIWQHLVPGGYFITQQVGERNMRVVKRVLGQDTTEASMSYDQLAKSAFRVIAFLEYEIEYVVRDAESLVFWFNALDDMHSDIDGGRALLDLESFNAVLKGNVDSRGFVTNEHRYLAVLRRDDALV